MAAGNTDMDILPGVHMPPSKVTSGATVKNTSVGVLPFLLLISSWIWPLEMGTSQLLQADQECFGRLHDGAMPFTRSC